MKTMIYSDLLTIRSAILQLLVIAMVIGGFLAIPMGNVATGVVMVVVVVVLSVVMNLCAYDDINDWQRFRLTLPISRRQVVLGRYASVLVLTLGAVVVGIIVGLVLQFVLGDVLHMGEFAQPFGEAAFMIATSAVLGSCVCMLVAAVSLPFIMRFGVTKATRFIMLAMALLMASSIQLLDNVDFGSGMFADVLANLSSGGIGEIVGLVGVIVLVCLVLYAVSSLIAVRLYASRQF